MTHNYRILLFSMYFFSSKQDHSGIETVKPLCAILANLSVHFLCYLFVYLFIWLFIYVFLYIFCFLCYWQIHTYLLTKQFYEFLLLNLTDWEERIIFVQEISYTMFMVTTEFLDSLIRKVHLLVLATTRKQRRLHIFSTQHQQCPENLLLLRCILVFPTKTKQIFIPY